MTATLPQPPTHYSFDCPSCRSMLSIPVEMEGITGPCPHCQSSLTAPPLVQSPEYAAYYYAHQQAYAEANTYVEATTYGEPPLEITPVWEEMPPSSQQFEPTWPTQPTEEQVSYNYAEANQWHAPPTAAANALPQIGLQPDITAPLGTSISAAPSTQVTAFPRRSPLLAVGLALGAAGLAAGVYFTLKSKPTQEPSSYVPAAHVPLSKEEATTLAAQQPPVAPPVAETPVVENPPSTPVVPTTPVAPVAAPTPAEIETAPKAVPIESPLVEPPTPPPVAKVVPDEPVLNAAPPTAPAVTTPELEQPSLLEEPRAALKAFLSARNWQERAKHTQHAEALVKEMKTYYTDHADGPIKTESIDYLTSQPTPDGQSRFHLFQVQTGEGLGFPVSVEAMDKSFKVDWRSFVEFKDLQLPKFFEKYSSEPATFHAVLHRSHYFGSDVPDQDGKLCFAVEPPVTGFTNYVWLDKSNSDLLGKLAERKDFGYVSYPVITLRWVKEKDGSAYVTLFQIVADNWRTDATLPAKAPPH